MENHNLLISGSPHIHGKENTKKIMWGVVIALVPSLIVSLLFFGISAFKVIAVSVISCLVFEWLITKYLLHQKTTISDGSAVITGILLAFNLPPSIPIWMICLGALVAIGLGKMAFGGLGNNPFNPALVARAFLLISFPVAMTSWTLPNSTGFFADAISGPTPLGIVKEGLLQNQDAATLVQPFRYIDLFNGYKAGSLGEISALAILLGGIYMLWKKIITWHIPVAFLGSAFIFSGILWLADPSLYVDPIFTLLTGGIMLGAVFMATDMVTSPMTPWGKIIFGLGCGILTILIRTFGSYPEGVSFAILIMNAFVPLINRACPPRHYGY